VVEDTVGEVFTGVEGEARGLVEGEARGLVDGEACGLVEGEARGLVEGEACGLVEVGGDVVEFPPVVGFEDVSGVMVVAVGDTETGVVGRTQGQGMHGLPWV
jgi:hypothetical protein